MAAVPNIDCTCVEEDLASVVSSLAMHKEGPHYKGPFDAIFLNEGGVNLPTIEELLEWSHGESFWVLHSIRKGAGKQLWKKIVIDERINVTFETLETLFVFPWPLFTPSRYLV